MKIIRKIFTNLFIFFIDKEVIYKYFVSQNEFRGQKLLNKKILDSISDLDKNKIES